MATEERVQLVKSATSVATDWLYENSVCRVCGYVLTKASFLWYANGVCFIAHTGLAITTVVMATRGGKGMNTPTLAIYRTKLTWNDDSATNALVPHVQEVQGLQLAWLTLSFFLLSAAAHGVVLLGNYKQAFAAYNKKNRKITRWSGWYFKWMSQARQPLRCTL